MAKKLLADPPKSEELNDNDKTTIIKCILNSIPILAKHGHLLVLISDWKEVMLSDIQGLGIIKFMGDQPYIHTEMIVSEVTKFVVVKNAILSTTAYEINRVNSGKLSAEEFVKSYTKLMKLLELYHNHVNHNGQ